MSEQRLRKGVICLTRQLWSPDVSLTVQEGNSFVDQELKEQEMRVTNCECHLIRFIPQVDTLLLC